MVFFPDTLSRFFCLFRNNHWQPEQTEGPARLCSSLSVMVPISWLFRDATLISPWDDQEYRWMSLCTRVLCGQSSCKEHSLFLQWWWGEPSCTVRILSATVIHPSVCIDWPSSHHYVVMPRPEQGSHFTAGNSQWVPHLIRGDNKRESFLYAKDLTRFHCCCFFCHGGYHHLWLKWIEQTLLPHFTSEEIEFYRWLTT